MTKQLSMNFTDTAISGVTTLTFPRGKVNFKADWRIKQDEPEEAILTNLTSPVVYPERMRISASDVANVYSGSSVEPSLYAPTKRGRSVLVQVNEIWKVTDSVDATYEVALPVQCHLVIKVPNHELVTPDAIQTLVGRAVSGLFETGSADTTRLGSLLRGSLLPSDL